MLSFLKNCLWAIPSMLTTRSGRLGLACRLAALLGIAMLALLLGAVFVQSRGWLDVQFLTSYDSRKAPEVGILAGILGTFWVVTLTALFSIPVGVGAAIYLEEYSSKNLLTRIIQLNLANLAGVPSIVYGILGLTVFVRMFGIFSKGGLVERWTGWTGEGLFWSEHFQDYLIPLPFGQTVIAGSLTLTLLILPVIIIATQEALRAVPSSIRDASLALGATKWQTIRHQVLSAATPGIMTGIILAISRAIGETAPLVMVGAVGFINFAPGEIDSLQAVREHPEGLLKAPFESFTVLPIQIFSWVQNPKPGYQNLAAAAIVVLLTILLFLNGVAIFIRNRFSRHLRW